MWRQQWLVLRQLRGQGPDQAGGHSILVHGVGAVEGVLGADTRLGSGLRRAEGRDELLELLGSQLTLLS